MAKPWVTCARCGRTDKTVPGHVGTKQVMRCEDCTDSTGHATLCRDCCPTGHGTHPAEERTNE